jgi:DNA repair protein RadC
MTPRQQSAFRGNVTWLMGKTTSAEDLQRLDSLRTASQPQGGVSSNARSGISVTAPAKRFSVYATRLKLERQTVKVSECPALGTHIGHPFTAAAIASELIGGEAQEHLLLLCLDVHNHISGVHTVHIGTTSSCVIKVADILRVALLANASSIILAHNHPSGDPTPSPEDILATKEVAAAGYLLDIKLLDHLVVTDQRTRFTSLATTEKGIFNRGYSWR